MAVVRVRWHGRYRHSARAYAVSIDLRIRAYVRDGETVELPVESGRHSIHTMNGWCGSPMVVFEAAPGETLEFECDCGPRMSFVFIPLAMFWSMLFPSRYLSLDLVDRLTSPFTPSTPFPQ